MMLVFKILTGIRGYVKIGLEKVSWEANVKSLKAPSPSPRPVPTVGVERIITEHWNSLGGDGRWSYKGYKYKQLSGSCWAENN